VRQSMQGGVWWFRGSEHWVLVGGTWRILGGSSVEEVSGFVCFLVSVSCLPGGLCLRDVIFLFTFGFSSGGYSVRSGYQSWEVSFFLSGGFLLLWFVFPDGSCLLFLTMSDLA
jgi:hypothetical protein